VSREIADHKLDEEISKDAKIRPENGARHADDPAAAENTKGARLSAPVERSEETSNPALTKFPDKELPPEFLSAVADKLLSAMGPTAPIVLRDHIRALGGSAGSLPRAKLDQLVKELGKEIVDDYHRLRFQKELSEQIQKLGLQANGGLSDEQTKPNRTTKSAANKEVGDRQEFPRIVSDKLAEAIGPIAPLVLREQIVALGESPEAFPRARIEELIIQVSIEISNESTRRQFQKEIAREIQKLKKQGAWSPVLGVSSEEAKGKERRAWRWGRRGKG
jgi:hypothetical protein